MVQSIRRDGRIQLRWVSSVDMPMTLHYTYRLVESTLKIGWIGIVRTSRVFHPIPPNDVGFGMSMNNIDLFEWVSKTIINNARRNSDPFQINIFSNESMPPVRNGAKHHVWPIKGRTCVREKRR